MAPNRSSPSVEVPCTPYSRPKQFETARLLFRRMYDEQTTPVPQPKLLFPSAAPSNAAALHSPPLTPEDDDEVLLGPRPAPTPSISTGTRSAAGTAPCTPPPTLPRGPSTECPKLPVKRNALFVIPPAVGASSDPAGELEATESLGSPLRMAPVPFPMDVTRVVVTTPRKAISRTIATPWAPKRPSFMPSSAYGPRIALRKPFSHPQLDASSSSTCSTPTKSLNRAALVGRINHLEGLVRHLQRELAAHKACSDHSSPTKANAATRRAIKASRPRPVRADSVFL